MLIGLNPDGTPDQLLGPQGFLVRRIPGWTENGGFRLDPQGRPIITIGYRPKVGPSGLAALRFSFYKGGSSSDGSQGRGEIVGARLDRLRDRDGEGAVTIE
jgi:hypothetical protein